MVGNGRFREAGGSVCLLPEWEAVAALCEAFVEGLFPPERDPFPTPPWRSAASV